MLEDFNLTEKRDLLRNKVDWDKHFFLTYRKNPTYVCLNIAALGELEEEERIALLVDMVSYLYG